jgi:hypothetical protein
MIHRLSLGLLKGTGAWGDLVAQRASDGAPVKTGRLARSIHRDVPEEIAPLVVSVLVGTNVEYARAHELGSGLYSDPEFGGVQEKYEIRPVFAKALAFEWPGGPKDHPAYDADSGLFFFGKVMHPGVRARPYLRPAIHASAEDGKRLVFDAVLAELRLQ